MGKEEKMNKLQKRFAEDILGQRRMCMVEMRDTWQLATWADGHKRPKGHVLIYIYIIYMYIYILKGAIYYTYLLLIYIYLFYIYILT
jgi:hypothetical protein